MTETTIAPVAAVRQLLQEVVAAWAANDADAFADLYTEDAAVILPGGVYHRDREQIRGFMRAAFDGPFKGSKSVDTQESVRLIGDDVAVVVSLSGIRLAGEEEVPAERMRRASWVLARKADGWLVESYHNCALNA
ncbi:MULTISPECIES: SgcJ/EcaC family oxidoreductase [unclassified Kitasatospora]|uniref:SgcJ/EcaC family oxidoreductase n=1 Tax=unclassified Kitasatospora TaxID=2633591 RepID=UPI00070E9E85|nr:MULTISPECIES: SgcJ/EcaC family oxidoreductase [unclassified Kitasatospora]KQV13229.1 hypothetical protein ASC99_08325 [Kitasatospora sp. Root107]KRB75322.1 hypothetical protein ASE03_15075 [Kitasatospora sp. Root187]